MNNNNISFPTSFKGQHQNKQPGIESMMNPIPIFKYDNYNGNNLLQDKIAIITGGDSGIGRAVALAYAKEGADIIIVYLDEHDDAKETQKLIENEGRKCFLKNGDIGDENVCLSIMKEIVAEVGDIDILVNNAAQQYPQNSILDISKEQLEHVFKTNIFSMFYMTKATLPHMKDGGAIINTASVTAYAGNETLIDYSATKGAVVSFTRSLSLSLVGQNIRVNAVAPGPIWTPLIPSSFDELKVQEFGKNVPMKRAGQPVEVAYAYVYLGSFLSSYVNGEVIHVNGGKIIN